MILTNDGLIATCAHVITNAGARPGETVRLIFHHTGNEATATVEPDGWRASETKNVHSTMLALGNGRICDLAAQALMQIRTPEAISAVAEWVKNQPPGRRI